MRDLGTNQKANTNLALGRHLKMRGEQNSKYNCIIHKRTNEKKGR